MKIFESIVCAQVTGNSEAQQREKVLWWRGATDRVDVREEINDTMLHEKSHVPVGLPLLRCLVHCDRLLQSSRESENQQHNAENKSGNHKVYREVRWDVQEETAKRDIRETGNRD